MMTSGGQRVAGKSAARSPAADREEPQVEPQEEPLDERLSITDEDDIVNARQRSRELARTLGFGMVDQSRIATAVSELTRNVVRYATDGRGEVRLRRLDGADGVGLEVVVADDGPGIADVGLAMREGYT